MEVAGTDGRLGELLRQVKATAAYRRVLSAALVAQGRPVPEVAAIVGYHSSAVYRLCARYRREGEVALLGRPRGGRHRAYLSVAEEDSLLAPFLPDAAAGGVLVAAPIKAAYEERVGTTVPKSTVYRLLARHGWRKVAPRRRHPGQDDAVQEEFKRGSPGWWWTRSPVRRRPGRPADQSG